MEKLNENPVEPVVVEFGDLLDLHNLYRVKGHPGLFNVGSMPMKSNLIRMNEFLGGRAVTVKTTQLECLAEMIFHCTDGEIIAMNNVLNNLSRINDSELNDLAISQVKTIMVPGFDPNKFKDHQAIKLVKWYLELKAKTDKYKSDLND